MQQRSWASSGVPTLSRRMAARTACLLLATLTAGCTVVWTARIESSAQGFSANRPDRGPGLLELKRDLELLGGFADDTVPEGVIRRIAGQPLAAEPGSLLDLGLMVRAIAQYALQDHAGLKRTRDHALMRGTDRGVNLAVQSNYAEVLRTAGRTRAAREAYAAGEQYLMVTSRITGKPGYHTHSGRIFLQNYLSAALRFGDGQTGDRIVTQYLLPLLRDEGVDPPIKLLVRMHLDEYRVTMQTSWGGLDPLLGYRELDESISSHLAEVAGLSGSAAVVAKLKLLNLRTRAANLALAAKRPSLALEQLARIEREAASGLAKEFAIDELRASIVLASQDYERGLAALDAMWRRASSSVKRVTVVLAGMQIGRANVLASLGRWDEAERTLAEIRIEPSYLAQIDQHAGLRTIVRAVLSREDPDFGAFDAMQAKYRDGSRSLDDSALYFGARTAVYYLRASRSGSVREMDEAVAAGRRMSQLLRLRQAAGDPDRSIVAPAFLQMAKEAYVQAALRGLGRPGVTLDDVLDAMQLLQTTDIDRDISAAAVRLRAIPGVDAGELRSLQDLQRKVAITQTRLVSTLTTQDSDPNETQRDIDDANAAGAQLDRRMSMLVQKLPGIRYAFGGAEPISLREIQARLAADESVLVAVPMTEATAVLLISKTAAGHHLAPAGRKEIAELVDRVRRSTDLGGGLRRLPDFDVDAARRLHRLLLAWGQDKLRGVQAMTVAATGPLAAIPFGLLLPASAQRASPADYRRLPWLVRSMAVSHVPSISSWLALSGAAERSDAAGFIAWADPQFTEQAVPDDRPLRAVRASLRLQGRVSRASPPAMLASGMLALPRLPETRREAQAVARALRAVADADILAGSAATRRSVIERSASGDLARRSVVMFATHGLVPSQFPGLDQPALAMAHDASGPAGSMLTLDDVLGLRLNADWVILSACNTASADSVGGDPLSGLSRGFFFAGASALLVTHWEVESESAAEITTRTIEAYASSSTLSRAQSLQRASTALIDAKDTPLEWSHPAYWAPYALVGDGRRRRLK